LPSTQGQGLAGSVGFPYASFLLGLVNNGTIGEPTKARGGKYQFGVYMQDTWKVTRKFTLDYGLRYDYSTYSREHYGRGPNFSAITANPTAGGRAAWSSDLRRRSAGPL
jgi:outer membrane receptor protein involved in Fe transport